LAFVRHPDNFRGGVSVNDHFFDFQARELGRAGKPWQLLFCRVFKLLTDIGKGHWLSQARVADRGHDWFDNVNTNDGSASCSRDCGGVRKSVIGATAKVSRQQDSANLQGRVRTSMIFCLFQFAAILHAPGEV